MVSLNVLHTLCSMGRINDIVGTSYLLWFLEKKWEKKTCLSKSDATYVKMIGLFKNLKQLQLVQSFEWEYCFWDAT